MIYLVDFVKFLHEQFDFIFSLISSFFELVSVMLSDFVFFNFPGLPSWLSIGLFIPVVLAIVFRITQIIPIIGGFDS